MSLNIKIESLKHLSATAQLILFFAEKTKGYLTTIQLFKFIYLADLYSVKWRKKPITELHWIRYDHGPFDEEIYRELDFLEDMNLVQRKEIGRTVQIKPLGDTIQHLPIPKGTRLVLENIQKKWSGLEPEDIHKLLDYVYATAPMEEAVDKHPMDRFPLNLFLEREKLEKEIELN